MTRAAWLTASLALACVSCQSLWRSESGLVPMPSRDEGVSFAGPGSAGVDRRSVPPIPFARGQWRVTEEQEPALRALAERLARGGRVILAGRGDAGAPADEYARVLGEARAQSVRQRLIRLGAPPERLQTVAFGEDSADSPASGPASCVEVGMLP